MLTLGEEGKDVLCKGKEGVSSHQVTSAERSTLTVTPVELEER